MNLTRIFNLLTMSVSLTSCSLVNASSQDVDAGNLKAQEQPNIVILYVDDLGYGDLGSYGAKGVTTPNVDELAQNGIRFTNAHSSAATCTPSRYSLLTGEYAFRQNAAVLEGDAKLLIDIDKPTLPKMLKKVGYTTAVVGKWHLGLGDGVQPIDWNGEVKPGPLEVGFDYSFLLPATGDRVPTVYLDGYKVVNLSEDDPLSVSYTNKIGERGVGRKSPELLRQLADDQHADSIVNGISRIGYMAGGQSAEWVDEEFHTVFTEKATAFIRQNSENPFFLFFSFHDIHVPRLPAKQFLGSSEMGVRGDAIVQMDWITGQIVKELERTKQLDNTIIIFTSDNGPVLTDGYDDLAVELLGEHKPAGIFKGGKYSAFEAGTRVPTIVHYPAKVKPAVSDALMSQVDLYSSLANYLGITLKDEEAIDSEPHIDAWLGRATEGRQTLIKESYTLSLTDGDYKYIRPSDKNASWVEKTKNIESGLSLEPQLYNLQKDPSESKNIAGSNPEIVKRLEKRLQRIEYRTDRAGNLP